MKKSLSFLAKTSLWLLLVIICTADSVPVIITPKNQSKLGLDFSITTSKWERERTYIVDFVIPPTSKLNSLTNISIYDLPKPDSFSPPTGISIPFMGLARFPRDSKTATNQVEWVRGVRLWIAEDSVTNAEIQFEHDYNIYVIHLSDYVYQ